MYLDTLDDYEIEQPEPTEAELQDEYEERIEAAADDAPPNVFYECAAPIPMLAMPPWRVAEFQQFLAVLTNFDLRQVRQMADAELYDREMPLSARKPAASIDYKGMMISLARAQARRSA
jgi:hypothetical protein